MLLVAVSICRHCKSSYSVRTSNKAWGGESARLDGGLLKRVVQAVQRMQISPPHTGCATQRELSTSWLSMMNRRWGISHMRERIRSKVMWWTEHAKVGEGESAVGVGVVLGMANAGSTPGKRKHGPPCCFTLTPSSRRGSQGAREMESGRMDMSSQKRYSGSRDR